MKTLLTGCLLALLTGCTTLRTNVRPDQIPDFSRVLVVSRLDNVRPDYVHEYVKAFPPAYQVCTLTANKLSFGDPEEAIRRQAESCRSEVILTLELSRTDVQGNGRYSRTVNDYYAHMRAVNAAEPFWKGLIVNPYARNPRNRDYIDPLPVVNRLKKDGILRAN